MTSQIFRFVPFSQNFVEKIQSKSIFHDIFQTLSSSIFFFLPCGSSTILKHLEGFNLKEMQEKLKAVNLIVQTEQNKMTMNLGLQRNV